MEQELIPAWASPLGVERDGRWLAAAGPFTVEQAGYATAGGPLGFGVEQGADVVWWSDGDRTRYLPADGWTVDDGRLVHPDGIVIRPVTAADAATWRGPGSRAASSDAAARAEAVRLLRLGHLLDA